MLHLYASTSLHSDLYLPFFFTDTAPTEIYTLSLHDALPISQCPPRRVDHHPHRRSQRGHRRAGRLRHPAAPHRSEEHTSELQSRGHLVCRLLLEKKKKTTNKTQRESLH